MIKMDNSGISVSLLKEAVCLETFEEYASANIFNMELVNKLDEVGYAGVYNYEVGRDSTRHITRPRKLTCNDLYDNYRSILWKK